MTIEAALFQYLTSDGTYTKAIIGNRIYPLYVPENVESPAISYQRAGGGTEIDHSGVIGQREATMQFDCQADGLTMTEGGGAQAYKKAKELANALVKDLVGFRGVMSGLVNIHYCNLISETDGQAEKRPDLLAVRCDFRIKYREV